jgi:chromosome segregation ATPase
LNTKFTQLQQKLDETVTEHETTKSGHQDALSALEKDLMTAREQADGVASLQSQLDEANAAHETTKTELTAAQEQTTGHESRVKELEQKLEAASGHEAKVGELEQQIQSLQAVEVCPFIVPNHP